MYLINLRRNLLRMFEADDGLGGNGGGEESTKETSEDGEGEEEKKEEKTFTQADVDKLIKDRVAREKKGQLSKEELKVYKEWKDSQKTEDEKKNEALTTAEQARVAAEERATVLEAKVTCLSKGVNADSTDDVVILAKAMVSDEVNIEQAIDKVLEKYPHFKGEQQNEDEQKGFKIGAGINKNKTAANDALAKIFGNKK